MKNYLFFIAEAKAISELLSKHSEKDFILCGSGLIFVFLSEWKI